jgi:hypothetical protein
VSGRLAAGLLAAVAAAAVCGTARADGDPASDVLYTRNVFLPYRAPTAAAAARLEQAVAAAFARGYRVKVAVVAAASDMGSVPVLFNMPTRYAQFLGQELDPLFVGPLLIVMPAGFGIYDGGRSTKAEEQVLQPLGPGDGSVEALTNAATAAIQKLTAVGALRSKDIRGPTVIAEVATAIPGQTAKLRYTVVEDSQRSREVVQVWAGTRLRATLRTPLRDARAQQLHVVTWPVPARGAPADLRYCVVGTDPSGNAGPKACAQIHLVSP